jgi:hypothetical protein
MGPELNSPTILRGINVAERPKATGIITSSIGLATRVVSKRCEWARADARAVPLAARADGASAAGPVVVGETVGSEGTDPQTLGSARNTEPSARQSPLSTRFTARSRTTLAPVGCGARPGHRTRPVPPHPTGATAPDRREA